MKHSLLKMVLGGMWVMAMTASANAQATEELEVRSTRLFGMADSAVRVQNQEAAAALRADLLDRIAVELPNLARQGLAQSLVVPAEVPNALRLADNGK